MSEIALPHTGRTTQATQIEQSRVIAEVQGAIVVAQQCPRNLQAAMAAMQDSCKMQALAERAFFRFPRAGQTVTGPSVHLARELARCWGNIQYGVSELSRDANAGESEMQASAWDLQTNTRASAIFIVPHKRDTQKGTKDLVDMRDIYENNANNGARRVRECIFAVLPPWFKEEAIDLCRTTIKEGGGVPLPRRISKMLGKFAELRVTEEDITRKLGRPSDRWTEFDVADLTVIYKSIERGEVQRDDEFPPFEATVTAAEIARQSQPASNGRRAGRTATPPAAAPPDADAGAEPAATADQIAELTGFFTTHQLDARYQGTVLAALTGRRGATTADLTAAAAAAVLDHLRRLTGQHAGDDVVRALDHLVTELLDQQGATA